VLLADERVQSFDDLGEGRREREGRGVDVPQAILGLVKSRDGALAANVLLPMPCPA